MRIPTSRTTIAVALFAAALLLVATPTLRADGKTGTLDIHWIDVEGGAATLLVTPAGESILVDTGNPGERDPGRINKHARAVGLDRIDHVVITHFHGDHFGGFADLVKLIPVGTVYDYGGDPSGKNGDAYTEARNSVKHVVIAPGDALPLKQRDGAPKLSAVCIAANRKFIDAPADAPRNTHYPKQPKQANPDKSANADSVAMIFRFGDFDFLDCGDLTWNMEGELVWPINRVGVVDVYQVNHHGLDSSNNPALIRSIEPTVAVMNNGHFKGCMPHTFETLRAAPTIKALYQVHRNLRIAQHNTAEKAHIANTEPTRSCPGHTISMSVDARGKSYTVTVPSTKHTATYPCK